MGSIVLKEFKKKENSLSSKPYTYVDLSLDLKPNLLNTLLVKGSENYRDIQVSYDEFAIKNSLLNIFNTIPGQRFLLPLFGSNLVGFLFKPISETYANEIGKNILRSIELWEPRVQVENVTVVGDPENHQYDISLTIKIPNLKIRTNLSGVLSTGGFRESTI